MCTAKEALPGADRMLIVHQAQSLKQVLALLSQATCDSSGFFQTALSLWLQLHEAVQEYIGPTSTHLLSPSSVAAVQAALHAVPKHGADEERLAWMKVHAPLVSKAVTACVIAQSEVTLNRLQILQQLLDDQGEAYRRQLLARLTKEAVLCRQLYEASNIALFFAPLATTVDTISHRWDLQCSDAARAGHRNEQTLAYMQRDALLKGMADNLCTAQQCILLPIFAVEQALQGVWGSLDEVRQSPVIPRHVIGNIPRRVESLLAAGSTTWLGLALQLPTSSKHDAAHACLEVTQ